MNTSTSRPSRPQRSVYLTGEEIEALTDLARSAGVTLETRLQREIAELPEGDASWTETAEALAVMHTAWIKLANRARG